ncbi:aspartate 1-decarboxylase [Acidithiobacillus sp. CV18-2]|uniref:Aspartate 1-decarboxylase n=1 Tax=Igneacidithiobacillus copahuensis TaxID=2724909 RepID=A0AAE3CJN7_9PROT|nr:aspartate 1-decarboxylase [Igneacidithiobacillus copahuensis]MBU2754490.1 aspartate 1-decarboxylase [Acidithiobacillus sp. CV18-3]MBU2756795.1 aspartate 1-decarboxylase [Acidithiobacillus sp. BN09-2]MBU2778362.1 aspartate 1-decarboxylase [Acidithiobacillus sp. CV18-2]MBU2797633.1 aspartate 1-decarboxylase [Acidithiobacillus sp. VAN18-2]MBU2797962.1 aspartate 1-decarboxylase [Acidithiobacillus sp. VAN18-4]UTV80810.1 aspartate 1-decarboxylase [Acidithiobacillus sp. YTS05]
MLITMLKSKLHRVRVTAVELDYEGSCAIDAELLAAAGILPFEQIQIYDVHNGERFTTYAISAAPGSGCISVNGAAARRVALGDLLIIASYLQISPQEAQGWRPKVVHVDTQNREIRPTLAV